jgi:hypothetical protein
VIYKAIPDTPYPKIYIYFENNLPNLSSLSRKEPDNSESYTVEEFTRYMEYN